MASLAENAVFHSALGGHCLFLPGVRPVAGAAVHPAALERRLARYHQHSCRHRCRQGVFHESLDPMRVLGMI